MKIKLNNIYIVNQHNRIRINIPLDYIKLGTLKVNTPYDLTLIEKDSEDLIIKRMVKKDKLYLIEFINGDIIEVPLKNKK